jgi:hypothetical protein
MGGGERAVMSLRLVERLRLSMLAIDIRMGRSVRAARPHQDADGAKLGSARARLWRHGVSAGLPAVWLRTR